MPTYKIEYGDSTIKGGLFLKYPSAESKVIDYTDGSGKFFRHLSTFSKRSTIKECLIESLETAQKHIFFTSFLIQDDQIIENLIKAVRRLKGHVYVVTTLKKNDFETFSSMQDQDSRVEWDFNAHMECVKYLARNGIFVKARKDCHAKFAVFDDKYAIVTSANSVATCFADIKQDNGQIREANPENGIIIDIPSEVYRIANFFRSIWRGAYNYYISPDSHFSDVGEFNKDIMPIYCKESDQPSKDGQIIWTAPNDHRILKSMIEMIDSAQQNIRMSSYVLKGMKDHLISKKLVQAANRGVNTELLVRGMSRRDHLESCYHLKESLGDKIDILGDFCNHSKAMVIDDKQAMILSANLDSQHGLDCSVEVGFMSRDTDFINSVSCFLDHLKAGSVLEFVSNPRQAQVAKRFSTIHEPIITKKEITINIKKNWKNQHKIINKLISEIKSQLVKVSDFQQDGKKKYRLFTDNIVVDFIKNGENHLIADHPIEDRNAEKFHFKQVMPESTITINTD